MSNWLLLSVPVLIIANAFFVAAEYAVVATRPLHLEAMRATGKRAAARAMERLKRRTADSIGAIQVCITMTNLLLGWLGEPAVTGLLQRALGPLAEEIPPAVFQPISVALAFMVVTLLTVVFSELLPKAVTLRHVVGAAVITAPPVLAIAGAVRPLVWLMNKLANLVSVPLGLGRVDRMDEERVTTAEIRLLTTEAAEDGELTPRERSVILNALTLADRPVSQIMVPRVRVRYLDLNWTMDENRAIINERLFSRLPLCNGGMDSILGIVHVKEFLSAYNASGDVAVLGLIARRPVFVPETQPMDKLLTLFAGSQSQMVIALDEYGGVSGVVTLRDAVNSLLGSREPAGDGSEDAGAGHDARGSFVCAGETPVHEVARRMHRYDWGADEASATIGGLVQVLLGHFPAVGEAVVTEGVELRVLQTDEWRVLQVEVRPPETPASPAGEVLP